MAARTHGETIRIGMVAGEKSGDLLGAGLIGALRERFPGCRFEGIGGEAMLELGFQSLYPMERLSVMGFVEPLARLPELLRMDRGLRQHFLANPPDVFVGIDSPGFNLRLESSLKAKGVRTVHYVSPSVWAYGEKRIFRIKRSVDLMLVLFPFEQAIYEANEIPVEFVGHPLADRLLPGADRQAARERLGIAESGTLLALLPGSRVTEIRRLAPTMLEAAVLCSQRHPGLGFLMPCATPAIRAELQGMLEQQGCERLVKLVDGQSHDVLMASDLIILASGTASLEAMLLGRPMIVCYKLARLTYMLASRMLKVPYVGLPNLLAGEALVPEYLQDQFTSRNLVMEVEAFLAGDGAWAAKLARFRAIHRDLARQADQRAAAAIARLLED